MDGEDYNRSKFKKLGFTFQDTEKNNDVAPLNILKTL